MTGRFKVEDYISYEEALDMGTTMIDFQYDCAYYSKPSNKLEYDLRYETLRNLQRAKNKLIRDRLPEHLKYIDLEKHMYDEED